MYFSRVSLYASAFIFSCIVDIGISLDCYHCNITTSSSSNSKEDPCKGIAIIQRCQDPAVCLAARYTYEDPTMPLTTTTMKTCYPYLGGSECQLFLKNIRTINPATAKIEFSESCGTCSENGCNHAPGESAAPPSNLPASSRTSAVAGDPTVLAFILISLLLVTPRKLF